MVIQVGIQVAFLIQRNISTHFCFHLTYLRDLNSNLIPCITNMGNKASRPARKLTKTIVNSEAITRSNNVQLPTQALKDTFEKSTEPKSPLNGTPAPLDDTASSLRGPEVKDGMDPLADQGFINSINRLGRQIHSHSAKSPTDQLDVTALKQLLNRKELHAKGQKEVEAQLEDLPNARTMVHPRTLTAILNALNDNATERSDIVKDYQVQDLLLNNMSRFKVADKIVIIEEQTKEDEIGPKIGQPTVRAAYEEKMLDYNGEISEEVDDARIKKLRLRLE